MAEIKRTFLQGKMNKDLDERLVPDGQYVDALNIQVAKSEGGDVGAIENSLGNIQKTTHNLTNAKCIGVYADHSNQLIYYCVTADEKDFVAEYDDKSQGTVMLLESTRVNGVTLLNFKKDKLITGIAKVVSGTPGNDLLAWTDDNEQPRIINIERAKTYGVDGFEEDDISLIKKPPIYSPSTNLTFAGDNDESGIRDKFLCFAYAYRYLDGEVSALSPFTNVAFSPSEFDLDFHTVENEGMQNAFSAVDISFNTGKKQVTDIILVFKESASNALYVIEEFNKKDNLWGDSETQRFRFSNNKIYRMMDENELFRLYDNVPRQAKALDIVGNRVGLGNYLEGYDLLDSFGERLKIDYNLSLFTKDLSGKALDYELLTLNVENDLITIDFSEIELKQNTRIQFGISLVEKDGGTGTYTGAFDFILNQDFADVTKLAVDPDFVNFVEQVMTDGFIDNYTTSPPADSQLTDNGTFLIDSYTPDSITLYPPSLIYTIDDTPGDLTDDVFHTETFRWGYTPASRINFIDSATDSSCKTNRSYEAAIVYLDEYGRSTTALTAAYNTLYIPQENSVFQNKIRVNVNHKPPAWAKYFRFAVKQNKKEYQTIYASIFYEDKLFRWIKLDGANKDKVKEGDTLIVKSDLNGPISDIVKVRVLEIKTQPEDFLTENKTEEGEDISEVAGLYMKIKVGSGFSMENSGIEPVELHDSDNKSRSNPALELGPLGSFNVDGVYTPYPLLGGSSVEFDLYSYENNTFGSGRNDEHRYKQKHRVNDNYDNFELWFEAEVGGFDGKMKSYEFFTGSDGGRYMRIVSLEDGAALQASYIQGSLKMVFTEGIVVFETEPADALSEVFYEGSQTFEVTNGEFHEGNIQTQTIDSPAIIELDFFNCYALGNGVESYRYKDALNAKYLSIDTRPTAVSQSQYREIRRYADITYSAPYVESLGINGLNNFNLSTANYKDDLVKKYGYIQKLIARDTDLLVFQEDKVSRVLYGKELIVGPDGSSNLASVEQVLGSQVMYAGEHGVSRNPESIAIAGNRIWWTDEKRNHVCRLSIDGITVISRYGMTSWFRNMFTDSMNRAKLGAFDPYHGKYVLGTNDQLVYNPLSTFDCGQEVTKQNFTGDFNAEVDFGISTGDVGISVVTDKPVTVKLTWNGVLHESVITDAGTVTFTKTDLLPRTAELTITASESTTFTVSGNCAILEQITVVSIVRGHSSDAGNILTNRYKWVAGNYAGPYKNFRELFIEDGGVAVWNSETGDEGVGYVPKTGSTVMIESYKGYGDTGSFGDDDKLGYLVSDVVYTEADIEAISEAVTPLTTTLETTTGGETINKGSFTFQRPLGEKYLYLLWDYSSLSININTHIFIYFDSSGSMNTTLTPLQTMRDTVLKDALLPLYENDSLAYDEKVKVISHSSERTLHMLNFLNATPPDGNVIVLVFQDEAHNVYNGGTGWTNADPRTAQYDSDISILRSRLNNFASNYYRGVIFQVDTPDTNGWMNSFQALVPSIMNGTGNYSGSNGLSDRSEFAVQYDVTPGATPTFYKDLIVTTLQGMGYNL